MKKSWTYTIIALIIASIAVAVAFLAGKAWDEIPSEPDDPDDPDNQDKKNDQDDKK